MPGFDELAVRILTFLPNVPSPVWAVRLRAKIMTNDHVDDGNGWLTNDLAGLRRRAVQPASDQLL